MADLRVLMPGQTEAEHTRLLAAHQALAERRVAILEAAARE